MRYALTRHLQLGLRPQPRLDRRALRITGKPCPHRTSRAPRPPGRPDRGRARLRGPPARFRRGRLVGVEFEWLTVCLRTARCPTALPIDAVRKVAARSARCPSGSRGHVRARRPGRAVHPPAPRARGVRGARSTTPPRSATALADAGIGLVGLGLEPGPQPRAGPAHAALRRDGVVLRRRRARAGRTMMCSTAAIQVNVDLGPDDDDRAPLARSRTPSARSSRPRSPTRRSPTAGRAAGARPASRCGARSTRPARRPSANGDELPARPGRATRSTPASC